MTSFSEPRADTGTSRVDGESPVHITIETAIDDEHAETFYRLYLAAFGPLRTRAAARQVLHQGRVLRRDDRRPGVEVRRVGRRGHPDRPDHDHQVPGDGAVDQPGVLPGPLPRLRRAGRDLLPRLQPGASGESVPSRARADVPAGHAAAGRGPGDLRLRPVRLQRPSSGSPTASSDCSTAWATSRWCRSTARPTTTSGSTKKACRRPRVARPASRTERESKDRYGRSICRRVRSESPSSSRMTPTSGTCWKRSWTRPASTASPPRPARTASRPFATTRRS